MEFYKIGNMDELYLKDYSTDVLKRCIFWDKNLCGLNEDFPKSIPATEYRLNKIIQEINLRVSRNVPYMAIPCVAVVNEFTRIFMRGEFNYNVIDLMLQIDSNLDLFASISHLLDCMQSSGLTTIEESNYKNMNGTVNFDNYFRDLTIIDILLDISMFNSYSFLRNLTKKEKKEFSKLKYEYYKKRNLKSLFKDDSEGKLEYYSFAFACHSKDEKVLNATPYKYEIDIDEYIGIWEDFVSEYFSDCSHVERSVEEQIKVRRNEHLPKDYHLKFENVNPGIYFILRTEKKNIPHIYEKQVCALFGIDECSVGKLTYISAKDYYQYMELYKQASVSVFKIVVP